MGRKQKALKDLLDASKAASGKPQKTEEKPTEEPRKGSQEQKA